jgi:hypothetical protein
MFVYLLPLLPSPGGYPDVPLLLLQPGLVFALSQPGGVSLPHGRWGEPGELNPGGLESLHVGGAPLGWPPPPPFLPWAIAAPVAKNNAAIKTATIAAINIFPTRYLPRSPQDVKPDVPIGRSQGQTWTLCMELRHKARERIPLDFTRAGHHGRAAMTECTLSPQRDQDAHSG